MSTEGPPSESLPKTPPPTPIEGIVTPTVEDAADGNKASVPKKTEPTIEAALAEAAADELVAPVVEEQKENVPKADVTQPEPTAAVTQTSMVAHVVRDNKQEGSSEQGVQEEWKKEAFEDMNKNTAVHNVVPVEAAPAPTAETPAAPAPKAEAPVEAAPAPQAEAPVEAAPAPKAEAPQDSVPAVEPVLITEVPHETEPAKEAEPVKEPVAVEKLASMVAHTVRDNSAAEQPVEVSEAPTKTFKVVMIRHGESEWNKENRFCGWYDSGLSKKGKNTYLCPLRC